MPNACDETLPLSEKTPLFVDVVWGRSYFHPLARFFLHQEDKVIAVPLDKGPRLIGRSTANFKPTIAFQPFEAQELGISRAHARIDRVKNQALLTDLDSTNGTFLDGKRIVPQVAAILHNGAALQLGNLLLRVEFR